MSKGGTKPEKKMFLQIVKQLREIIIDQHIQPGDKLPSERVLSEQLNTSRSSVSEAFRSLELLGLIETRHGGGTFLADVRAISLLKFYLHLYCKRRITKGCA